MQLAGLTRRGLQYIPARGMRSSVRRSRPLLLIATALTLALAVAACGSRAASLRARATGSVGASAQASSSVTIRAAHLIQGTTGWALSDDALSLTSNGGQSWTGITPPGVSAGAIRGVYFLDTQHGWVVSSSASDPDQLEVSVTTDGGTSWSTSALGSPDPSFGNSDLAYVDFADSQHGWVVAMIASSAGILPQGVLFQTTDDGATWQKLQMPVGGPVEFVNATTGWLADGNQGEAAPRFYITSDGGQSWTPETVTPPTGFTQDQATYTIPSFTTSADVVLAAFDNGSSASAGFYQTNDAGTTWQQKATVPAGKPEGDVSPSTAVVNPISWMAVSPYGTSIMAVTQNGASQSSMSPTGLPANSGISDVSFTGTGSTAAGWVVSNTNQCTGKKTGCTEVTALLGSTDGGAHWAQLSVP